MADRGLGGCEEKLTKSEADLGFGMGAKVPERSITLRCDWRIVQFWPVDAKQLARVEGVR